MNRPDHRLDKHGFPIPPKFDQAPLAIEPQPQTQIPSQPASHRGRWVLVVLLLLVGVALVAESPLLSAVRQAVGNFYLDQADHKYLNGDLPGALADLDTAMEYMPDNVGLYRRRGQWRVDNKDLEGGLADFTRLIEIKRNWGPSYVERGYLYLRMGRHREALDDLNLAVKFGSARDADMFNARAYGRALAGVELEEALEDVEKAIEFDNADRRLVLRAPTSNAKTEQPKEKKPTSSANANYLDTRGYILYLLGKYDLALDDLNGAIHRSEDEQRRIEKLGARPGVDKRQLSFVLKERQKMLAVMYHHRGQIHEKRNESEQAKSDLDRGDKLGYNPAEGVF
jgi:tetratricopeptide (TPR) repeat protein